MDIRFLLCLVALETLASVSKESIAESVADIGARVLASDSPGRGEAFRDLKNAYDTRSRFVHSGEIPSLALAATELDRLQARVLGAWAELSRRFFDLVDHGLSEKQLSEGFEDFRGIAPFKYGAAWEEVFRHPGATTQ